MRANCTEEWDLCSRSVTCVQPWPASSHSVLLVEHDSTDIATLSRAKGIFLAPWWYVEGAVLPLPWRRSNVIFNNGSLQDLQTPPESEKAKRYIQQLDEARCAGRWADVPELCRKVEKHAPHRRCQQTSLFGLSEG